MRTRAFYCEGKLSRLGGVGVCGVVLGGEVTGQCLRLWIVLGKLSWLGGGGGGVSGRVLGGEVTGQCLRLWACWGLSWLGGVGVCGVVLGKLSWLGGVGVCGVKKDQGQSIKDNPPSSIKTANEP